MRLDRIIQDFSKKNWAEYNSRIFRQAQSSTNIVGLGPVVESLPATKSCSSTHDQTVAVSHILRVSSPPIAQPPLKGQEGLPVPAGVARRTGCELWYPKFVYAMFMFLLSFDFVFSFLVAIRLLPCFSLLNLGSSDEIILVWSLRCDYRSLYCYVLAELLAPCAHIFSSIFYLDSGFNLVLAW